MKRIFILASLFVLFNISVFSQKNEENGSACQFGYYGDLHAIQPDTEDYDNIHVKELCSGKDASSFLIWVKKEVKLHYHATHTENVYVIEGNGKMKLGDKEYDIKKGDWLYIPEKTHHSVVTTSDMPLKVLSIQSPEFKGQDRIMLE